MTWSLGERWSTASHQSYNIGIGGLLLPDVGAGPSFELKLRIMILISKY